MQADRSPSGAPPARRCRGEPGGQALAYAGGGQDRGGAREGRHRFRPARCLRRLVRAPPCTRTSVES
eukprot:scaffold5851_cov51-Phaeocystis_antarctica.AAC.1